MQRPTSASPGNHTSQQGKRGKGEEGQDHGKRHKHDLLSRFLGGDIQKRIISHFPSGCIERGGTAEGSVSVLGVGCQSLDMDVIHRWITLWITLWVSAGPLSLSAGPLSVAVGPSLSVPRHRPDPWHGALGRSVAVSFRSLSSLSLVSFRCRRCRSADPWHRALGLSAGARCAQVSALPSLSVAVGCRLSSMRLSARSRLGGNLGTYPADVARVSLSWRVTRKVTCHNSRSTVHPRTVPTM